MSIESWHAGWHRRCRVQAVIAELRPLDTRGVVVVEGSDLGVALSACTTKVTAAPAAHACASTRARTRVCASVRMYVRASERASVRACMRASRQTRVCAITFLHRQTFHRSPEPDVVDVELGIRLQQAQGILCSAHQHQLQEPGPRFASVPHTVSCDRPSPSTCSSTLSDALGLCMGISRFTVRTGGLSRSTTLACTSHICSG